MIESESNDIDSDLESQYLSFHLYFCKIMKFNIIHSRTENLMTSAHRLTGTSTSNSNSSSNQTFDRTLVVAIDDFHRQISTNILLGDGRWNVCLLNGVMGTEHQLTADVKTWTSIMKCLSIYVGIYRRFYSWTFWDWQGPVMSVQWWVMNIDSRNDFTLIWEKSTFERNCIELSKDSISFHFKHPSRFDDFTQFEFLIRNC
jgi:hypothetical protein